MSIFVSVEDKEGDLKGEVFEIEQIQSRFKDVKNSHYLRFITEDIDTRFNRYQAPFLAEELETLRDSALSDKETREIQQLLNLCKKVNKDKNLNLNFYGDKE